LYEDIKVQFSSVAAKPSSCLYRSCFQQIKPGQINSFLLI